jgi:membrane protein implicated in regulation of membrane protease activity
MRNLIGCVAVLFLVWLGLNIIAGIVALLFMNTVTGSITMIALFGLMSWGLYKFIMMWAEERDKE